MGKKERYNVILVCSDTGRVTHQIPKKMKRKAANRWVKLWEEEPEGQVAVAWPDWAPTPTGVSFSDVAKAFAKK